MPGRQANRRNPGPAGDGVSAGLFIHLLVATDSETQAVPGLLVADIWTREGKAEISGQRRFDDKKTVRWLRALIERTNC